VTTTENETGTEQTAAEDTKAAPTDQKQEQAAEGKAAQTDGLDELLKEFDTRKEELTKKETKPESESKPTADIDVNALAVLEKRLNDQEARETARDLSSLWTRLSEGTAADNLDVEIFVTKLAREDPRLEKAFMRRVAAPNDWAKTEKAIKAKVAERFGKKVDKQVTESRNAVESAIRGASTAAPDRGEVTTKEVQNMSKDDFDNLQRKMGVQPV